MQVCTQPITVTIQILKASTANELHGPNGIFGCGSNLDVPEDQRKAPRAIIIAPNLPNEDVIDVEITFKMNRSLACSNCGSGSMGLLGIERLRGSEMAGALYRR